MDYEIVITGMSGKFPESDSIAELSDNLYNKVDLLTEDNRRFEPGLYGLPRRMGKLKDISKFDSQYFGINPKQAHQLDPQIRILLELTHETIVDAGYDPKELRGRNIGVFIGNNFSDSLDFFTQNPKEVTGYGMSGCHRTMLPNRISSAFDFKGPSSLIDTACSASLFALHDAVRAIQNNECEAAIIGGAHLCLKPETFLQFHRLNMLAEDGACRSFDMTGAGFVRSESIVTIFIQKSDAARRKYASIVHIKTNTDGFKDQGILYPSVEMQTQLIREVLEESKLNPLNVSYVEAHGTGTKAGDPIEMSSITEVYCKGRKGPLLMGSVKSNMGHSEAASGLCSVVKVLISMEKELIPPNIHFNIPNPACHALLDNTAKIVTEATPWNGDYAAICNYGFGGVNIHVILKSNQTAVQKKAIQNTLPQLVLYSGRTEEGVQFLFDQLDKTKMSREFFTLLHKSAYTTALANPYRGYKVLAEDKSIDEIKPIPDEKRPIWFVFTGMGCQWPGMGKQLMNLDIFANTIKKLAEVLKPYNIDLIDYLINEETNSSTYRSVLMPFLTIAATQIALVDILRELNVEPDSIIGHSAGEVGCAYADGCLTAEEAILATYFRAKATEDSGLIEGAMAALGLTWKKAKEICPDGVFSVCNNAEDSVTIAGPKESVKTLVEKLITQNIFAKEVDSCGFAFHCKYIHPTSEMHEKYLKKVILNPKLRSKRWISTSFPEDQWTKEECKYCGPSYFVNNMVSPVLFHEALSKAPENALLIEIAPHHLLLAILKRSVGPNAEYIGLMKRKADNIQHLLSSFGKIYNAGVDVQIEKLYPKIQFPVSKSTPMISPLIKWNHSESWLVPKWDGANRQSHKTVKVNADKEDSPDHSLLDHCIDGRCLYPGTGYFLFVWRALSEIKGEDMETLPVRFENFKIHGATVLSKTASIKFVVDVATNGGEFEISEGENIVCTGRIYSLEEPVKSDYVDSWKKRQSFLQLNPADIYKELKLRGYDYGPNFQGVIKSDFEGNNGLLKWTGDWITYLDAMMQFIILGSPKRALYLPTHVQSLKINPLVHMKMVEDNLENLQGIPVIHEKNTKCCISGGVEIKNLKTTIAPRHQGKQTPSLEEYHFVPYNEMQVLSEMRKKILDRYIMVCSSVTKNILEKCDKNKFKKSDLMNGCMELNDSDIAKCSECEEDSEILLKILNKIKNTPLEKNWSECVKRNTENYLSERDSDKLSKTMLDDRPLKTLLHIVLENNISDKLKIAEAVESKVLLSSKLMEQLQTSPSKKTSFSIAHTKPELVKNPTANMKVVSWSHKAEFSFKDIDFFILKYLNCNIKELKQVIENASSVVKDNGFIAVLSKIKLVPAEMFLSAIGETDIPIHSEADLEQIFKFLNLKIICKKSDSITSTLYLLRKTSSVQYNDITIFINEQKYDKWVNQLREELIQSESSSDPRRIWLVNELKNSGINGLVNCLRQEPGGDSIRCINNTEGTHVSSFNLENKFYQDILQKDLTMNVFKKGVHGSYRSLIISEDFSKSETSHAYLNVLTRGNLSSLVWVDAPLKYFTSSSNSVLCQVYYAPLNFRDIMLASGKLPADAIPGDLAMEDCILGLEFSGKLDNGKRVMGCVPAKGLATTVAADPEFMWEVPKSWTLEEASTVPIVYSTAYYALVIRGNLKKENRVLIHSGSGGVGQAAIAIALSIGCEVFISVGSSEKKEFLKKRFKVLQNRNFCNSRDTSFEQYILNATKGEGVEVILNSLADDKLKASLNCLAQHGRFLEIGKYDLSKNSQLGMNIFLKNISFHGILLDALFENTNYSAGIKREVVKLIYDGISDGTVKPLHRTVYNHDQSEQAFRYMASGKHIGKVVIKIRDEEPKLEAIPKPVKFTAIGRTTFNPKKSIIIVGGLGGYGLELCEWLTKRGAKHIVLASRSGVKSGYQQLCVQRWLQAGINILLTKFDATKPKEAESLLKLASSLAPVGAIFNSIMVLRDAFMENQTVENFQVVGDSKILSTQNLDLLSRKFCPELEYFVCFSSVICFRGNPGQSNYGLANSVMERICEERREQGLPGHAVQYGVIGDVGALSDSTFSELIIGGTVPQRINSCLLALEKILLQSHPVVASYVPHVVSDTSTQKSSKSNILSTLADIFGIKEISSINPETSLGELGMDSLIGVEVKQHFERDFDLIESIPQLRQYKIKDLKELLGEESSAENISDVKENTIENTSDQQNKAKANDSGS